MENESFISQIQALLLKENIEEVPSGCERLDGGRNNQVYKVCLPSGPLLVKRYFSGGDWDRLQAESRFLRFCERSNVGHVPKLLAEDVKHNFAIHSWVEGARITSTGYDEDEICSAATFLSDLSIATQRSQCIFSIKPARDAHLSLNDFFRSPSERIIALKQVFTKPPDSTIGDLARKFFFDKLIPVWEDTQSRLKGEISGRVLNQPLLIDKLIVSPSDFGLHNALKGNDGSVYFVDFEYAGLDDPTKTIGDFICQPSFPISTDAIATLSSAVYKTIEDADSLAQKIIRLLPLFRIKFCCIILNDFKDQDNRRRLFSMPINASSRLEVQLKKAEMYLSKFCV